jgi:hypothetical protein
MLPTLRDGDRLLLDRARRVTVGDLVVVRLPRAPGSAQLLVAVKRAVHREPGGWWVERDNRAAGVDSWHVGPVTDAAVLGVVVARWWPRPTWLGRPVRERRPTD